MGLSRAAERRVDLLSGGGRIARVVVLLLAFYPLGTTSSAGLDARTAVSEFSLMNWAESDGPFPFGVYAIAQDHDGYLWLGTRTGLIRFDGLNFTVWKSPEPLPEDRISVLRVARDGSLWLGFGTIGGVTRIVQGRVTNFDERDGVTAGSVNALLEANDGTVWVGTFSGLSKFQHDRWERFGLADGLPDEPVLSLHNDARGTLWVGTSAGVYRRGPNDKAFEKASPLVVTDFAEDSSGVIWVTDPLKGFRRLDDSEGPKWGAGALNDTPGRALLHDRSGALWVGTRSGGLLRVRDASSGRSISIERLTRREGLGSDEIRTLFEDADGTLWVGTRTGLSRLSESSVRAAPVGSGDDAYVYAVTKTADGSVWTATGAGLWREVGGARRRFGVEEGLPGQIVTALHEDRMGTLWVATTQGIAYSKAGRFARLVLPPSASPEQVRSITTDASGAIWICDSIKGLLRWNGRSLERVTEGVHDGRPYVAHGDSVGRVWVGFWSGGLTVYHNDTIVQYSSDDGLPGGTVNVIHEDQRGWIWVGTSRGLGRLQDGRFERYEVNGIPESTFVSIVEDERGALWFGAGAGLLQISPLEFKRVAGNPAVQLRYHVYDSEDGLPGTLGRPGTPSATRGGDGRLWFTTSVGLAVVDPERLRLRPQPGPLRIESIVADGRRLEPTANLRLPPRTSRIEIDYSSLNLTAARRLRSRYRLEGFESEWQDAGERRQATYTNLPPGFYNFRVVSTNADGSWSEAGAALEFSVAPAFYQTKQFYSGIAIFGAAAVWAAWQLRVRRIRRQFDLVLAERARVAREIHDTLLQSLVGVALEFDDISDQLGPSSQPLKDQVGRIRARVEHYIRETRQSIWDLRSPTLETTDLVTALHEFGSAATGADAMFEFAVTGKPRRLAACVEEQLLRIGQEAVNNALRHADATVIRMEMSYEPAAVRLKVADDGRGFDPDRIIQAHGVHWGVTSMRERAEQIGARFTLTSSPGGGTVVETIAPPSYL